MGVPLTHKSKNWGKPLTLIKFSRRPPLGRRSPAWARGVFPIFWTCGLGVPPLQAIAPLNQAIHAYNLGNKHQIAKQLAVEQEPHPLSKQSHPSIKQSHLDNFRNEHQVINKLPAELRCGFRQPTPINQAIATLIWEI